MDGTASLAAPLRLLLLALATASCSAPPPVTAATWLQRFAGAARFVPEGMTSLWFSEPCNPGPDDQAIWLDGSCRVVRCASSFGLPRMFGLGPITGVTIEDHESGVPAARLADLGVRREADGGFAIWHRPQLPGPSEEAEPQAEQWAAVVDDRFVVIASDEPLLRAALAMPAADLTSGFAGLSLPADTVAVVFRLPQAGGDGPRKRAHVEQLPYACVLASTPVRLVYWTRSPEPDFPSFGWTGRAVQQPPFHGCEARPDSEDCPLQQATLQMLLLFGAMLVI